MYKLILLVLAIDQIASLEAHPNSTQPQLRLKKPLPSNYTRKPSERLRLECEFEYTTTAADTSQLNPTDFTLYWVKNYQELLHTKKGVLHILRKNMTTILIIKKLEPFDTGSYTCVAELATAESNPHSLNSSSETTLLVQGAHLNQPAKSQSSFKAFKQHKNELSDYLIPEMNDLDELSDEFPSLNPTIVENFDDKGFCEPYKGSICAGVITNNFSVYSTSPQQQEIIEERLRTIIPLLTAKNSLSKRCSTFAVPSLCLFAFPLCDKQNKQPKQICRLDCKQLQQDLCKNEYFNVKSLFESKLGDNLASQSSNFLLDCNQLPPSSDSPSDCLPIVSMTLDKIDESQLELNAEPLNCVVAGTNGAEYKGRQSITRNGYMCAKWSKEEHNFCRNLDNDPMGPWCHTTNPRVPKDYCNIPQCADVTSSSTFDQSILKNNKLLIGAGVALFLILFFMFVGLCFCCKQSKQADKPVLSSAPSSASQIHPTRLRMSNASLGPKKQLKNGRASSSKSSVASSNLNQNNVQNANMEMNPFIKNYDNPQPMFGYQSSVNQLSPNNIRLLQEIGKGKFGPVYVGELLGSFTPSSVVKCVVKTLNSKPAGAKARLDIQQQTTSTPNVNNRDCESHFMENEFYNEISSYAPLRHKYIANLLGVCTESKEGQENDDCESVLTASCGSMLQQCMVFEHLNSGDLHEYLVQRAGMSAANVGGHMVNMGSQDNLSAASSVGGASSNYLSLQQQQRNIADFLYIGQQIASGNCRFCFCFCLV